MNPFDLNVSSSVQRLTGISLKSGPLVRLTRFEQRIVLTPEIKGFYIARLTLPLEEDTLKEVKLWLTVPNAGAR